MSAVQAPAVAPSTFDRDVDRIVAAMLRQHRAGIDVGELLAAAARAAQARLAGADREVFRTLVDNRPGSWEAELVRGLMAGWDR